jgi:ribosomal protein S18 acetylase RimI-like enzyme
MIAVRRLIETEAEAFRALRHRALVEHPAAFFSSPPEERSLEDVQRQLRDRPGGTAIFGAFDGSTLVGTAGIRREQLKKGTHKAFIWGMYVAAEARRQGVGRALLEHAIEHARSMDGVALVQLSVSIPNPAARELYASIGFATWGIEPDALRVDDRSVDEEHMWLRL